MPPSREFVDYLVELMAGLGDVKARAMFGGYGLYLDGLMFGLVADEVVYIKVDDVNRDHFEGAGREPFRLESKNAVMSYYTVPDDAMDDGALMVRWATYGVEAAQRSRDAKKPKKSKKAKKRRSSGA